MIVYQVKDTAAATCGQPLIAESPRQAVLAVGRLLSSDQDLGSRSSKICVEFLGRWNGVDGFSPLISGELESSVSGDRCVQLWSEAVNEAARADAKCEPYVNPKMLEVEDDGE